MVLHWRLLLKWQQSPHCQRHLNVTAQLHQEAAVAEDLVILRVWEARAPQHVQHHL
jgi:hypothetical protein